MKSAYIIPGFTHTAKHAGYSSLRRKFQKAGYEAKIVRIDWKYKTMTHYVQQFLEQYERGKGTTVVLGFSYGAMIAAIAQKQAQADTLLLCSLSPYFKEDMPRIKKWWKDYIGKRRVEDFRQHSCNEIAKTINSKIHLIAGGAEHEALHYRVREAHKLISKNVLHILPDVKHDIADKRYQEKVSEIISAL